MEGWRNLTAEEIRQLQSQHNSADNWEEISVVSTFFVDKIHDCHFSGKVSLGEGVSIRRVPLLRNCWVGDGAILTNVGEIAGEDPPHAFPVEVRNEDGSHAITAHPDMTVGDAYLCSVAGPEHPIHHLCRWESSSHFANVIGRGAVIKNVSSLQSVWIGERSRIAEATQLENVYVHSSAEEPTSIGAGVILRDAVIGLQNTVDTHTIVRNVLTGSGVSLTEGLRISHCVVGDNSRLSCCEVLFSLIFPFHEQHHNSSFLIAATIKGQSNLAAGATVGSNHNGRKNDCALLADRGFWPGLCTSVKFPSRFAAYTLLVKGDYPYEINLPYPFCLVRHNVKDDALEILPAYWWRYNAFALQRNMRKYQDRDRRKTVVQQIHANPLAPDTVQQIIHALNQWQLGAESFVKGVERSQRPVRLLKAPECFHWYREMLVYYAITTLGEEMTNRPDILCREVLTATPMRWVNVGGQLMRLEDARALLEAPADNWADMHQHYGRLMAQYPDHNRAMACFVLKFLCDGKPTTEKLRMLAEEGTEIIKDFEQRALRERERDLHDDFRKSTLDELEIGEIF
ncbi:MAG: DUF4954 family protein [Bacteroidales bacterium]|nr:DUF4954 family protein [Bacteroidales bacterium]